MILREKSFFDSLKIILAHKALPPPTFPPNEMRVYTVGLPVGKICPLKNLLCHHLPLHFPNSSYIITVSQNTCMHGEEF